jgi:hypothetical protein
MDLFNDISYKHAKLESDHAQNKLWMW